MGDSVSAQTRSRMMAAVPQKDTSAELCVRRMLFAMGYRYRTNVRGLPGRPDIAFIGRKKAIFVHGCFWHAHSNCRRATFPKSRQTYWSAKLAENRQRDARVQSALKRLGWGVITVWECELGSRSDVSEKLTEYLGPTRIEAYQE